jgi:hypothetical protein
MSAGEIPYRLKQLIQSKYEEYFCAGRNLPVKNISVSERLFDNQIYNSNIFPPEIYIFGKKLNYSKGNLNWHRDIFSGKSFPQIFSKKINIRKDQNLSAKNVWEVNRLQFLPHISLNYYHTSDSKYLNQFIRLTNYWIDSNPYLIGINWSSNIEINIRLINWFFCWEILNVSKLREVNSQFDEFVEKKWIPSIFQHCVYSYNNPSLFSSANNHLIAEYAGLFIASSKWKFKESDKWLAYAAAGLEKEIILQHSNGINREEAAEYIQFITDFFLLAFVVGEKTNNQFSKSFTNALKEIFEYILEFIDINGNYPNYGDGDDGKVVCLEENYHFNNFISLLTSASIIFKEQRFKLKSTVYDLKNQILFGNRGKKVFMSLPENVSKRKSHFYQKEGHFIFRKQNDSKEIYLHLDAAPLGYLSMAAHGHSDALSIIMNINGYCIFVDPGTYSYHVSKDWRDYFVSTMAHNTVCIDGRNQANHVGDTMWLDHYKCHIVSQSISGSLESVKAEHNGYKKTKHTREILYNKPESYFIIQDEIFISDGNDLECTLLYHIHPDIKIEKTAPNVFLLTHQSGIRLSVSIENFAVYSLTKGQMNPVLGWYSDSFMQKVPTNVISAKKTINKSFKSITKIQIHEY